MKIGRSLFVLALVAGSSTAVAADDVILVAKHPVPVTPTSINGAPFAGGFSSRSTVIDVYKNIEGNATGLFTSTGSTPRWNMMDDLQFVPTPADYTGQAEPILGASGPLVNGNLFTEQFAVGFVYNGGDSGGNILPRLGMIVSFYDTDMPNTLEDPVNNPDRLIGSFGLVFSTLPAQTGNIMFTTDLFSVTDANSNPVRYHFPNGNVAVSYQMLKESVDGSGTFDIPATVYTAGMGSGTFQVNSEGNFGPQIGGSAAIFMRDASGDGLFQQTEYRNFTQPTNGNFYIHITGYCATDFDGDDFQTGDDFDAYVAAFELGDISADFDGDGFTTGDDFDKFVAAFEKGC